MCVGWIVHGIQVNEMAYGYLQKITQEIELAVYERITSIKYNLATEGYWEGGICALEIITNQKTYGPFGTVGCERPDDVVVEPRSQTVPDGMGFSDFFKSIARLTEKLFTEGGVPSPGKPFVTFADVFTTDP